MAVVRTSRLLKGLLPTDVTLASATVPANQRWLIKNFTTWKSSIGAGTITYRILTSGPALSVVAHLAVFSLAAGQIDDHAAYVVANPGDQLTAGGFAGATGTLIVSGVAFTL